MQFLKYICTLSFFILSTAAAEKPNVLFIAVDDLNDWVGHLQGHPNAVTPNIDRLAKRGVSFSQAHCAAPLCNPSRISLLTGIAPHKSGVYGNREKLRQKLPDAVTIMQHFRASDYTVKGAGKIFHGTAAYDEDSWDSYHSPQKKKLVQIPQKPRLAKSAWAPWGPLKNSDEDMFDAMNTSWLIAELAKNHDKPFFLACGFTKPHLPWKVPQKYFDMHPLKSIQLPKIKKGDLDDVPAFAKKLPAQVYDPSYDKNYAAQGGDHQNVLTHNQWPKAVQAYLATISFVDTQIGRILDTLDNSKHAENTIIILWGDHGWHLGEKEHWRKHTLWEVATRTPLIISTPNGVKGQLCERPVSLLDIYPTLIDLCALPERKNLDGQSLKPLLQNPQSEWSKPVLITYGHQNHALQTERWRYIQYRDGTSELYDHSKAPNEWTNLSNNPEYTSVINEMKRALPKEK
jgi:arylsulfatase A-like enzyme